MEPRPGVLRLMDETKAAVRSIFNFPGNFFLSMMLLHFLLISYSVFKVYLNELITIVFLSEFRE